MGLFKNKLDLPLSRMIELENQIEEQNQTYEICTGEKIGEFSEFNSEKYLRFFGFEIVIKDLSCFFDGEYNYMTMKNNYGNPIINIDSKLAEHLKNEGSIEYNTFLINRFSEVSVDYYNEFKKYPNGSIFMMGKIDTGELKLNHNK